MWMGKIERRENKVPEDRVLNDGDTVTNAGGNDFYVSVSDGDGMRLIPFPIPCRWLLCYWFYTRKGNLHL